MHKFWDRFTRGSLWAILATPSAQYTTYNSTSRAPGVAGEILGADGAASIETDVSGAGFGDAGRK